MQVTPRIHISVARQDQTISIQQSLLIGLQHTILLRHLDLLLTHLHHLVDLCTRVGEALQFARGHRRRDALGQRHNHLGRPIQSEIDLGVVVSIATGLDLPVDVFVGVASPKFVVRKRIRLLLGVTPVYVIGI